MKLLLILTLAAALPTANADNPRPILRPVPMVGAEIRRAADTHYPGGRGPVYIGEQFDLDLTVKAPGAKYVKIEVDEAAYGSPDALRIGLSRVNVVHGPTIHGYEVDADGRAHMDLGARLGSDMGWMSGELPILMKVTLIKPDGAQTTQAVNAGNIAVIGMKRFRLSRTFEVMQRLGFKFYKTPTGPTPWICEGVSNGPSGSFSVGMGRKDGDLTFNVRSGPLGGNCRWDSSVERTRADHPWRVVAMNFQKTATSQCRADGGEQDAVRAPPTYGTLRHEHVWVGRFSRIEMASLSQPLDRFPVLHVGLTCGKTASNDHSIEVQFSDIELMGPEDETPDMAFDGLMRH